MPSDRPAPLPQTPSQTVGPFFHIGMYRSGDEVLAAHGCRGHRIALEGTVRDGDGEPVGDCLLELWQPDADGVCCAPSDPRSAAVDPNFLGFGRVATDGLGRYRFQTVKPGRLPGAPAPFANLRVFARGLLVHLVTRVYFADEAGNEQDEVLRAVPLERRATLLAVPGAGGDAAAYRFDIRLQGEGETVFFEP